MTNDTKATLITAGIIAAIGTGLAISVKWTAFFLLAFGAMFMVGVAVLTIWQDIRRALGD
jgi:hypothetical protein